MEDDQSKQIHYYLYEKTKHYEPSQFFYDDGSSILWKQEIVVRIWSMKNNCNLIELHNLSKNELIEYKLINMDDFNQLEEDLISILSKY